MQNSHSSLPLEVTHALLNKAREARFNFGEDTALVAVQHMLKQTIDLIWTVCALGISVDNIFALGKVYSNSPPVMRYLRKLGVTIVESTEPEAGEFHSYFEHDVDRLWKITSDTLSKRKIKRILILDDSGVCITNVPGNVLQRYSVCGVEQTSLGMFRFEEKTPRVAVISWARSAVKTEIGGLIFAKCLIDKVNTEFLHGRPYKAEQLGIIGMGSIGRAVANLAVKQTGRVFFYDRNLQLDVPQRLHGRITRLGSLAELLLRCDFVIGCSGRNPFRDKWPSDHKPGIKLLSSSSGDQEFGPIINDVKNKPDFKIEPASWNITS